MTCIIGLEYAGAVWMGADSYVGEGHTADSLREPKVHRSGIALLGHSGSYRRLCVLRAERIQLDGGAWTARKVTLEVVPQMVSILERHGVRHREAGSGPDESGGTVLCIGGRVFEIDSAMSVVRSRYGYSAIGSDARPALGSLASTADLEPRKRVLLALEAAERHTPTVRRPWKILCTKETA
jgi:20S proteasome alpha/beta subunit